jgi:hypothetical protein
LPLQVRQLPIDFGEPSGGRVDLFVRISYGHGHGRNSLSHQCLRVACFTTVAVAICVARSIPR